MKFKSLFNKKIEKTDEEKKKAFSFKKMLAVGATTLALISCDGSKDIDYSGWENDKEEVADIDTTETTKSYCDSSLVDKNFSTNVSLEQGESMYFFNRVKIIFNYSKNQKFYFTIQPENSSTEELELYKNKVIQVNDDKNNYNILEICSYDFEKRIITIASNDSFLPYLFKGGENEIIEKSNQNYEQIIHREYYWIEGNSITDRLLIQEKNWIFPPLENLEERTLVTFDNEEWLVGNTSSKKVILFKESAYYGGMSKDSTLHFGSDNTITFISTIMDEGVKYAIFELNGKTTQKVIVPENELLSIIFEGEKINLYVRKIYDSILNEEEVCDLSVISNFLEFTSSGNKIDYTIYDLNITADVNFSTWENTTKLEMYPNYSFEDLIKRKEREE